MKLGDQWPNKHDLSKLRLLGSVGEPINPEAWLWYYRVIGKERCPIVDTWWMTETGMHIITPLPGITPLKPGSATFPFVGLKAEVRDANGVCPQGQKGELVITRPWPAMLRGLYNAHDKYVEEYWSKYGFGNFYTGDGALIDEDGYFWLLGRIGDVINVAGHRLGTAEVESALVRHEAVAEAAVALAARRMEEARKAAEMIGATFETLDVDDGEVYVTKELTEKMARLIRKHRPDLIITNRPVDYHRDHRYTAQLILDVAYMLTVPLFCPDTPHLERMPVIAYWWDRFEEIKPFRADVVVAIDDVIEGKIDLLMAHESQVFEWLPYNAGELESVPSDEAGRREFLARRIKGRAEAVRKSCEERIKELFGEADFLYAEAFQISQYGRQLDPEELKGLFPV